VTRKSPDGSSCVAAGASICASAQNKFKNVYEELYNDNERGIRHSTISVLEIAKKNNLNLQAFNACMSSKEVSDSIAKDVEEAEKLEIKSTPSLFINNKAIDPGTPDPIFLRALLTHLTKKI
jgi:protein-disulfide isomerase